MDRLRARLESGEGGPRAIPLVVPPRMGEVAGEFCLREGACWIDLCGNARIQAPGLHVHIEGKPDLFRKRGRPANLFAPHGARIAQLLLSGSETWFMQRVLSLWTRVDEPYTSRVVRGLLRAGFAERNGRGELRVARPRALLEALRENYRPRWVGTLDARLEADSPDALLRDITARLQSGRLHFHHALTGRAAAWRLLGAPEFSIATVILSSPGPSPAQWEAMGFQIGAPNPNVRFLLTKETSPYCEMDVDGEVRTAHPVQVYLDLHAEGDREAADLLRGRIFPPGSYPLVPRSDPGA